MHPIHLRVRIALYPTLGKVFIRGMIMKFTQKVEDAPQNSSLQSDYGISRLLEGEQYSAFKEGVCVFRTRPQRFAV